MQGLHEMNCCYSYCQWLVLSKSAWKPNNIQNVNYSKKQDNWGLFMVACFLFFVLIAEANHNSSSPIPASFVLNQTLYVTEYDPKYRYQVSYSPTGIICFQQSLSHAALSDPVHITAHAPLTFSSNIDST